MQKLLEYAHAFEKPNPKDFNRHVRLLNEPLVFIILSLTRD